MKKAWITAGLLLLCLSACEIKDRAPATAKGTIGQYYDIKHNNIAYSGHIVDIDDKIVSIHVGAQEGSLLQLYRGLYLTTLSNDSGNYHEKYFEHDVLESLFPLKPGKEVNFSVREISQIMDEESVTQDVYTVHIRVKKKKKIRLAGKLYEVFLIIQERYENPEDLEPSQTMVYYYSQDLGIRLKTISDDNVIYFLPREAPPQQRQRRRAGTVAI